MIDFGVKPKIYYILKLLKTPIFLVILLKNSRFFGNPAIFLFILLKDIVEKNL